MRFDGGRCLCGSEQGGHDHLRNRLRRVFKVSEGQKKGHTLVDGDEDIAVRGQGDAGDVKLT